MLSTKLLKETGPLLCLVSSKTHIKRNSRPLLNDISKGPSCICKLFFVCCGLTTCAHNVPV